MVTSIQGLPGEPLDFHALMNSLFGILALLWKITTSLDLTLMTS